MSEAKKTRLHSYEDEDSSDEEDTESAIAPSSSTESIGSTGSLEQEMEKFRAPEAPFLELCAKALMASPLKRLCVQDIYDWLEDTYPFFTVAPPGWKNSVRHCLSKQPCFVKVARCKDRRGFYWGIHTANIRDFSRGDFKLHRARQRVYDFESNIDNQFPVTTPICHFGNPSPAPSSPLVGYDSWRPSFRPMLPSPLQWLPPPPVPLVVPSPSVGASSYMFQASPTSSLLANTYTQ